MYEKPSSLKTTQVQRLCEDTMRLLPLMLLVVCCSASAGWMRVYGDEDKNIFIDITDMKKNGDRRIVRSLQINAQGKGSQTAEEEHNCKKGRYRLLQLTTFQSDGGVEQVLQDPRLSSNWILIKPDSLVGITHRVVCSK